jgi:hypothetical protein
MFLTSTFGILQKYSVHYPHIACLPCLSSPLSVMVPSLSSSCYRVAFVCVSSVSQCTFLCSLFLTAAHLKLLIYGTTLNSSSICLLDHCLVFLSYHLIFHFLLTKVDVSLMSLEFEAVDTHFPLLLSYSLFQRTLPFQFMLHCCLFSFVEVF